MKAENPAQNYFINLFNTVVEILGIEFNLSQAEHNKFAIQLATNASNLADSMHKDGLEVDQVESEIIAYYSSFLGDVNSKKVLSCIETYFSDLPSSAYETLKISSLEVKKFIEKKTDIDSISENDLILEIMAYCENIGLNVEEK